ncbi:SGNH/GDSL hydrolase family protein [Flavitalea flava]
MKQTNRIWKKVRRLVIYGFYLILSVFLLLEIALRIYNPFHLRLKGDKIVLPVNQTATITNRINPKLDPIIVNTRNSLGFRGPEPPNKWNKTLTIITIGGSTTECHFLNDERTWPFLLGKELSDSFPGCWLNNAGFDGHSTFGHGILLNDHVKKLRPSVILFLVGINDVEAAGPSFHDKLNTRGAYPDLKHYLFENSEVLNLLLNLSRGWRAQKFNNTTNALLILDKNKKLTLPDTVRTKRLAEQKSYLAGFRNRILQLVDTCSAWHILPVFITQPNQFGAGKDSLTGADLELFPADSDDPGMNGKLLWDMLEEYNDVTRSVCREKQLPMIDLAHLLPKNSLYFYDMSHFTNKGAEKIASLLSSGLTPVLKGYFPEYHR